MNDFRAHLRRQLNFIKNSCDLYDNGDVDEAIRIAVALRVLFHDSKMSKSLLKHLNSKSILLVSTAAPFVEEPAFPNLYLVETYLDLKGINDARCHCRPLLKDTLCREEIPFDKWWGETVIEHKTPRTILARRSLVLAAANQDGGAHVDEKLDAVYNHARLGSGLSIEIDFKRELGGKTVELSNENVHLASLRQIGYEVLNSPQMLALQERG